MPVTLNSYEYVCDNGFVVKSAENMDIKFRRAVNSFLSQTYHNKELIVVSDGCLQTVKILISAYSYELFSEIIKLRVLSKQPIFSGFVRQAGLEMADGHVICYLDADDFFGRNHLKIIADNFAEEWVYYDDYIVKDIHNPKDFKRIVKPEIAKIGTSSIAHLKNIDIKWGGGYGHDWAIIEKLLSLPYRKIPTPEYFVCHCSQLNIDV